MADTSCIDQELANDKNVDSAPVEVDPYDLNPKLPPSNSPTQLTAATANHDGEKIKAKTEDRSDTPAPRAAIKVYRRFHDYDSHAIHDALQHAAQKAQQEQATHEAEKQKARQMGVELNKEFSKVWLETQGAEKKNRAAKVRMQEAEKSEVEAERTIREMERKVRALEKKAWEKRAWRNQMNFRRSVERNEMQKDLLQNNEQRAQRAEDRASDAWSRVEEMKTRVQKAEEDLEYES